MPAGTNCFDMELGEFGGSRGILREADAILSARLPSCGGSLACTGRSAEVAQHVALSTHRAE